MHPEYRRADQQVTHCAPANTGDHREEDEGHQRLLLFRGKQRARHREYGDADIVEDDERVGKKLWRVHCIAVLARNEVPKQSI